MILRAFRILLTFAAIWAIWLSYGELKIFRGTVFWEFRYMIWMIASFLALSIIEWGLGWLYKRFYNE